MLGWILLEMLSFIIRILGNALALYAAFNLVPGFVVAGSIEQYLIAGFVLALLNMIVKPVIKLISFPLILLTLGLFTIVINALMIWLLDYLVTFVAIESLFALFAVTVIVSVVNIIVSPITNNA